MGSRIKEVFGKRKAFIPFITAGDPCLDITEQLVLKMEEAGADMIELGIPFSDPAAEGVAIQKADERALAGGVTVDKIFDMVSRLREKSSIPLALMTYINPVFVYGSEKFMENGRKCQIDALIVPDMPYEERDELLPVCEKYGVDLISCIASTSRDRIKAIAAEARGFIYCVSFLGVTGMWDEITTDIKEMVSLVKSVKDIPCAVGFDVSTPEQAAEIAAVADGVITGDAIIKLVEQYGKDCIIPVFEFVASMRQAVRGDLHD